MPSQSKSPNDIENAVVEDEKSDSALKSFLAGGVGGICEVLVGHPLDLIKVRMQTTGSAGASESVLGMFMGTFRAEGMTGLFRGVSAPLLAISPIFAVSFWGYDMGQRLVCYTKGISRHKDLTISQKCIAGGIAAIPTTVLMAPSERIKVLLQTNSSKYSGMVDCARAVYREGGLLSFYRGTGFTLLRDIPGSIVRYGTYEACKIAIMNAQGKTDPSQLSLVAVLGAGGMSGITCWTVAMPADVLKSRYQSAPKGTYNGLNDVYVKLIKEEGYGALFKGIRPALIRAFPANAACFLGMELARKFFAFLD